MCRSRRRGSIGLRDKIVRAKTDDSQRVVFGGPARAADIFPGCRPVEDRDNGRRSPALLPLHQVMARTVVRVGSCKAPQSNTYAECPWPLWARSIILNVKRCGS